MARVRDLWTKRNPDRTSRTTRVRSARWGKGKRWLAVWDEHGHEVSEAFDSRDAAEAHIARVVVGQDQGTWITKDKASITLENVWDLWIAAKAGRSKKTVDGYKTAWNHIKPVFGDTPVAELDGPTLAAWIPTLTTTKRSKDTTPRPLGSAGQRKVGIVLRALLGQAVKLKIIHELPLDSTDVPRQLPSERRYLKVHEIDALEQAAPTEAARLLIMVLVMTGMRPGEAKGLKVKDLDPDRGRLYIRRDVDDLGNPDDTKTKNHRDVPVGGDLLDDLEDAADGRDLEDWLIPDEHGNVWTTTRWRRVWATTCESAGLNNIDTYTLKHTAASMAIAAGADAKTVQRMLGHASAAMTLNVYSHLWEEHLDDLPGAITGHMDAERARAKEREKRRENRARRRKLRAVGGGQAG